MNGEFTVIDDNNVTIGSAETLTAARDLLDAHCQARYGEHNSRLTMRNYGPMKDDAGLYSEMLELRLEAYVTRAFIILMPAGWTPKDYTL